MARHLAQLGLGKDEIPSAKATSGKAPVHRRRNVVITVVVALLVVYFFALGRSYLAIQDGMDDVSADYDALTDATGQADYSSAVDAARKMTSSMDAIQAQTQLWIWGIPARLPIIGDDVRMARTLAAVGKRACDDALEPVCDRIEKLVPTDGSDLGSAKDLSKLIDEVEDAEKITKDCEKQIDDAGDAHFSKLNNTRNELKSLLKGINDTYEGLHDELEVLKSASDLVSIITG